MKKLSLFCAVGLCFASFAFSEELEFDSLEISGSKIKNDEKPFVTPGATSTREGIGSDTQSIDSIVRSIPGTYTNTDQAQGTVQVNIRGMSGFGRVNTMIDGVTQLFMVVHQMIQLDFIHKRELQLLELLLIQIS